ncbi:hypothetical protein [Streptomyces sp. NPDC014006]|uniref:hypothetical protein n=1 Tax=Streptomyces sp. NPDC014006 TaxID=3364870 RepID=UPI003700D8C3
MNGNQIEGLIGMLFTLGILVLLVLPSALGVVRDRRMDRQIREAAHPAPRIQTPRRTSPRIQAHRTVRPRM